MHIATCTGPLSSLSQMAQSQQAQEAKEGAGPDHDGDGDDTGVSAATAKSITPPSVGSMVDVSA